MNLTINPGDFVRLQVDASDTAAYYILDLVDLENIGPPLTQPAGSQSVMACGAVGNGVADDTLAINNCVSQGGHHLVSLPVTTLVTTDINVPPRRKPSRAPACGTPRSLVVPPRMSMSMAGCGFNGEGSNTHFADFAILGKLNNRDDSQAKRWIQRNFRHQLEHRASLGGAHQKPVPGLPMPWVCSSPIAGSAIQSRMGSTSTWACRVAL